MKVLAYLTPTGMKYYGGFVDIDLLINDLLIMEDHIKNGANKDSNRVRVNLIRARIQTAIADIATSSNYAPAFLPSDYMSLLAEIWAKGQEDLMLARIVSSIQAGSLLRQTVQGLESYKGLMNNQNSGTMLQLYKQAAKTDFHIAMMLDIYQNDGAVEATDADYTEQFLNAHREEDVITHVSNQQAHEMRINAVLDSVNDAAKGQPTSLSLGDWKHSEITETLYQGIFTDNPGSPILVPIIYSDGSEARPFPFRCLPIHNHAGDLATARPLKMGMMSGRHPEMDSVVSGYWLQNIEVSQHKRTLAEADEAAYVRSKIRFQNMRGRTWNLWFAQTGYPPAVVGFLRALVEEMLERSNEGIWLYLVPQYYDWDRKSRQMVYIPGIPWF